MKTTTDLTKGSTYIYTQFWGNGVDDEYKRVLLQNPKQKFLESIKTKQEATVGWALQLNFYQTPLHNKLHQMFNKQ